MPRTFASIVWWIIGVSVLVAAEPQLKTASNHPMQYYVSLPDGWTPKKKWPILVAIDGSGKDFLDMARLYAEARKQLPFIIVSPVVLTNGGTDLRSSPKYQYSSAVWDEVDRAGRCKFDLDGLVAAIKDVRKQYNGETHVYITGFSAGAHAMWAIAFKHPELLAAAAPASGNFVGRCMDDDVFSTDASRGRLAIRGFLGDDELGRGLDGQFARAKQLAEQHGYRNISQETVAGGHDPHADAVIKWFATLAKAAP